MSTSRLLPAALFLLLFHLSACSVEPVSEVPAPLLNDPPPAPAGDLGLDDAWTLVTGEQFGQQIGSSVAAGDLTGDGIDDLVVNSPGDVQGDLSNSTSRSGLVFVFAGPLELGELDTSAATLVIHGADEPPGTVFGDRIAVGDVDGDGSDDLLVDAPGDRAVFLFYGPLGGDRSEAEADAVISTVTPDGWGYRLPAGERVLGDFDGDGDQDIVLEHGSEGFLIFDAPTGEVDAEDAVAHIDLQDSGLGNSPVGVGDLTGDGRDDLLVPTTTGLRLFSGPLDGELELDDATSRVEDGVHFAVGGDLVQDGRADLLLTIDTPQGSFVVVFDALPPGQSSLDDARILLVDPPRSTFVPTPPGSGDVNSDGHLDLVVDHSIFYGPFEAPQGAEEADVVLIASELAGARLMVRGDLNFDGVEDLLAAAPDYFDLDAFDGDEGGDEARNFRPHGAVAVFAGGQD